MKTICFLFTLIFSSCGYSVYNDKNIENEIQKSCERGYFEGQADAINGDIRIKLNTDSCYIWIKSPWNDGMLPIYNPTFLDTRATKNN